MNHDSEAREISLLIEEYRALQAESAALARNSHQIVAVTLLAGVLLAAASPVIVQVKASIVFLGAPLLFAGLSWLQLNCLSRAARIGDYLRDTLAPRARAALAGAAPEDARNFAGLLSFEDGGRSLLRGQGSPLIKLLFAPIALAPIAAPWLAAALSAAAYFVIRSQMSLAFTKVHAGLTLVDAVILLYTAAWILRVEARR